jgi:general secretion pathway protein H
MKRSGQSGFTLVELMVVLAIIALAFAVVTPNLRSRSSDVRDEAARVSALLRLARTEAIFANEERTASLDLTSHVLSLDGGDKAIQLSPDMRISVLTARDDAVSGDVAAIRFLPDGQSSGGAITLENARGSAQVKINWLTGAVHIAPRSGP